MMMVLPDVAEATKAQRTANEKLVIAQAMEKKASAT